MQRRLKILHVVESFSAGVATGIEAWIDHSSDRFEHVVIGYRRPGVQAGDRVSEMARFIELPAGKIAQVRNVWRTIRSEQPDVVHAHSTFGALYARTAPFRMPPIVYTPHCFGFERTDLRPIARSAVRGGERLLASRTKIVAGCSRHEAEIGRQALGNSRAMWVPHSMAEHVRHQLDELRQRRARPVPESDDGVIEIAVVGRISPQKDPDFLVDVARLIGSQPNQHQFRFVWIGGGEPETEDRLRNEGIEVTGWMPRDDVLVRLADATVYLHCAAWEGMPLTVLEALYLGLPVVARNIDALGELNLVAVGDDAAAVAAQLSRLSDRSRREKLADASRRTAEARPSPSAVGQILAELYDDALAAPA